MAEVKSLLGDNHENSWRKFGRNDPYFGVLTEERFRASNLNGAALKDFFATGQSHVARLLDTIEQHVVVGLPKRKALDFGCGVGRLLLPLAQRFESVSGIDISQDYLAETLSNAKKAGLSNLDLFSRLDEIADRSGTYDLLHSCIVFNHIPLADGTRILGQMAELTKDGGVMAVQMLHCRHASRLRRFYTWGRYKFAPLNWLSNWMRGRPVFEPIMQANEYPLDVVIPLLQEKGATDFYLEFARAFNDSYVFLYCRIVRTR